MRTASQKDTRLAHKLRIQLTCCFADFSDKADWPGWKACEYTVYSKQDEAEE